MAWATAGCEPEPNLPAARQLQVYPGNAIGPFVLAAAQQATRAEKELRREHAIDVRGKLDVDAPEPEAPQP